MTPAEVFPLRCRVVDEGERLELRIWRGGALVVALPLDARLAADLAEAAARRVPRDPRHPRREHVP